MPKVVGIKLTDAEYESWSQWALTEGLTIPMWVRSRVNLTIRNETRPVGKLEKMVRLQAMPLADDAEPPVLMSQNLAVKRGVLVVKDESKPFGARWEEPELCPPSMRECGTCGKDYDGNLHDSCPHDHVPNGKRK